MSDEERPIIRARTVIEVLGKPKEHVVSTLKEYIGKIKEDQNFKVITEHTEEAVEQDEGMFSTFVELEIETKLYSNLAGFCFDYMPSSIEIVEPDKLTLKAADMSDLMNDLQAKLHTLDMGVKQLRNENTFLKRNVGTILQNLIKVALLGKKLGIEQLSKGTGINQEELKPFLDALEKSETIKKEGEFYVLNDGRPETQS